MEKELEGLWQRFSLTAEDGEGVDMSGVSRAANVFISGAWLAECFLSGRLRCKCCGALCLVHGDLRKSL